MFKKLSMVLLLMAGFTATDAAEVSTNKAAAIAQSLLSDRIEGFDTSVKSVQTAYFQGEKAYYVVQFAKGGWALIAADDRSQPLLGYNGEGTYPLEDQPENVKGFMNWMSLQVVNNARQYSQKHQGWDEASRPAASRPMRAASDKIEPLIKICWSQSGSYNKYCPSDANGRAVVGCVAVGMAQAMSVAQWPDRPVGQYGYTSATYGSMFIDYDQEPAYDWTAILNGSNGLDNVARLLWHCGVSVNMDYGVDGSGTQTQYIANALVRNFKYPKSVRYYSRDSYSGDWAKLVLTELKEGRAVPYSGADLTKNYGHCFNIDGYDGTFYHVNWGWGNPTQYNGYYPLDGLKDTRMDCNYTSQQGVVVGIRQPSEKPSDIILSNLSVQAGQPAGTYVADVTVESEAENPTYDFTVEGPYNVIFHRKMPAPFKVVNNQLVTTEELSLEDGDRNIDITVKNTKNGGSVTRSFTIKVTSTSGISDVENKSEVINEQYFNLSGMRIYGSDHKGVTLVRQYKNDGSRTTVKRINK